MKKAHIVVVALCLVASFAFVSSAKAGPWSEILNPAANLSLLMGSNVTSFKWDSPTGTGNLFSLSDSLNNTGTGYVLDVTTAAGSQAKPLHVKAQSVDALTVLANGKVGIGTASTLTTLTVNDLNPVVSLKNKRLGSTEYQIRNGVLSPTSFDIFDKTYNTILTQVLINEARKGKEITVCESCSRILYIPELLNAEPAPAPAAPPAQ
jgi:hypothetical protein